MLNTGDILKATGGNIISHGPPEVSYKGVSTDSRTVSQGELFVPIIGERFDGHEFITAAEESGASGTLVQAGREAVAYGGLQIIEVADTVQAFGDIARYFRAMHGGLTVVGITGTNGKTTTKEMLASVLSVRGPVLKNAGNLNNLIGLPLTLMGLTAEHWAAVVEMGMSGFGEIARLAEIASPSIGVITNIGPGHLESLGSMEGVARAKGELIAALPKDGKAVLNLDDPHLKQLLVDNKGRAVTFGLRPGAMVSATEINESVDGVSFKLSVPGGVSTVSLPVMGAHNVYNALAAAAAAWSLGLNIKEIKQGIEAFSPARMRMEVVDIGGVKVINDAYNANPASMAAALNALISVKDGRRVAVLGDMLELGAASDKAHYDVGRLAGAEGLGFLVLIGEHAGETARGAAEAGMEEGSIIRAAGPEEAASALAEVLRKGDHLLVKGSRGMRMERIVELLKSRRLGA